MLPTLPFKSFTPRRNTYVCSSFKPHREGSWHHLLDQKCDSQWHTERAFIPQPDAICTSMWFKKKPTTDHQIGRVSKTPNTCSCRVPPNVDWKKLNRTCSPRSREHCIVEKYDFRRACLEMWSVYLEMKHRIGLVKKSPWLHWTALKSYSLAHFLLFYLLQIWNTTFMWMYVSQVSNEGKLHSTALLKKHCYFSL
jgi:hypothetical protein